MTMYTAFDPHDAQVKYRFRSIMALVRRIGGDHYHVEHSENFDPGPRVTIDVLKRDTRAGGSHVVAVLRVPAESLPASAEATR